MRNCITKSISELGWIPSHPYNEQLYKVWSSIATLDYKLIWVAPLLRTEKFIVVGNKIYGL